MYLGKPLPPVNKGSANANCLRFLFLFVLTQSNLYKNNINYETTIIHKIMKYCHPVIRQIVNTKSENSVSPNDVF